MLHPQRYALARVVDHAAPRGADEGSGEDKPVFDPAKFVDADTFGKTAAKIRGLETTLTEISKKTLNLDTLVEIGLLAKGEDGKYSVKSAAPPTPKPDQDGNKPDPQVAKLTDEVTKLQKTLQAKEREAQEFADKAARQSKADAIKTALGEAGAVKPSRDYVHLMDLVTAKEGGGFIVASKDKYGNDVETPLADFVKQFIADNPELAKATGQPGSGTPQTGGGQHTKTGATLIPRAQWSDMDWYAKNAAKFKSGEYVRDYEH